MDHFTGLLESHLTVDPSGMVLPAQEASMASATRLPSLAYSTVYVVQYNTVQVAEPRLVAAADEQQLTRRAHHRAGQPVQLGTPRRQLGLYHGVLQILQIL